MKYDPLPTKKKKIKERKTKNHLTAGINQINVRNREYKCIFLVENFFRVEHDKNEGVDFQIIVRRS